MGLMRWPFPLWNWGWREAISARHPHKRARQGVGKLSSSRYVASGRPVIWASWAVKNKMPTRFSSFSQGDRAGPVGRYPEESVISGRTLSSRRRSMPGPGEHRPDPTEGLDGVFAGSGDSYAATAFRTGAANVSRSTGHPIRWSASMELGQSGVGVLPGRLPRPDDGKRTASRLPRPPTVRDRKRTMHTADDATPLRRSTSSTDTGTAPRRATPGSAPPRSRSAPHAIPPRSAAAPTQGSSSGTT